MSEQAESAVQLPNGPDGTDTERGTKMAARPANPAKAQAVQTDLADHGKFAELASRRVSNVIVAIETVIKLGRTRGVAITPADKAKVLGALKAKLDELDRTWTPGENAKATKANGFAI